MPSLFCWLWQQSIPVRRTWKCSVQSWSLSDCSSGLLESSSWYSTHGNLAINQYDWTGNPKEFPFADQGQINYCYIWLVLCTCPRIQNLLKHLSNTHPDQAKHIFLSWNLGASHSRIREGTASWEPWTKIQSNMRGAAYLLGPGATIFRCQRSVGSQPWFSIGRGCRGCWVN
jgi:hypothetical protein